MRELEERIPTSQQISFVLQENLKKKESSQLDSLEGCEIPKRDSDNSDLDNLELVSIEL